MSDLSGRNLAAKYSKTIDERFTKKSQVFQAINSDYDFTGDKSVKVYSYPIAPLVDYSRTGTNRYGTPMDMTRNVQVMSVEEDKGFSFVLDQGDFIQSEFNNNAAKSLQREIDEVIIPIYDTHVFQTLADAAVENGSYVTTAITKNNAFSSFLDGVAWLGNHNVPDTGRVCFCTYNFGNLLMQDTNFVKASESTQEMLMNGYTGTCFGVKIVMVNDIRLPSGAAFILTHKDACTAPQQLAEYKIHENVPGISGALVEGRFIYDAFVLNEKIDAVYYHGGQSGLKAMPVITTPAGTGQVLIVINEPKEKSTSKWYYKTAATRAALPAVTYNTNIDPTSQTDAWYGATELTSPATTITVTSGHTMVRVVEVTSAKKPVSYGDKKLPTADS